ncbi:MAG: hypothetical protein JWR10_1806 [Rubritepida sp.]|nr:hypothetical protein [Rubritepida sp.]
MDDILASIRKILNEDEQAATTIAPPSPTPRVAEAIQLTPDMMITPPESLAGPAPVFTPTSITPPPPTAVAPPSPPPQPEPFLMSLEPLEPEAGLVHPTAAAATFAAFDQLSRVAAQDRSMTVSRGGPSIEDVVREEIRPLLKAWLDEHLPRTVERLVRAEIERVMSRQG